MNSLTESFSSENKPENTDETLVVESSPIVFTHEDFGCADCYGGTDPNEEQNDEEDLEAIKLGTSIVVFETVRSILTDVEMIL